MTVSSIEEGFDVSCIANKRLQIDSKNQTIVFIEPITISKLCRVYGVFLNWVCKVSYFVDLVIVLLLTL